MLSNLWPIHFRAATALYIKTTSALAGNVMMGFMTGTIFANRKLSTGLMGRLVQAVFVKTEITKQRKAEKAPSNQKRP